MNGIGDVGATRLMSLAAVLAFLIAAQVCAAVPSRRELAVCADPNSLPMSNRKLQGFENRIAALIASDLHATVRYTWYAQRRGFLRKTLKAGLCDVVMGVPPGLQGVATTRPYYTSAYSFVAARQRLSDTAGFDDPALRSMRIGLPLIGAEGTNPPPATALAFRGLTANVVGYSVWADDSKPAPEQNIIGAVARGEIDTAIVWGPYAGYFAKLSPKQLAVIPIVEDPQLPQLTFAYDIAIGVRSGEDELRDELQEVLVLRRSEIEAILEAYGVPLVVRKSAAGDFFP